MKRSCRELLRAALTRATAWTNIARSHPVGRHGESFELNLDRAHRVRIRPLREADRDRYVTAVAALSPRSRYLRFASPQPKLTKHQVDLMMRVDGEHHVAYAALTPDEAVLLGVARYIRAGDNADVAEVAIAVADDWQRRGLGRILLSRLIDHARSANLERLVAMILGENRAAAELSRAVGFGFTGRDGFFALYEMPFRRQRAFAPRAPA